MTERKCGVIITPEDLIGCDWGAKLRETGLNTLGIHSGGGLYGHDVLEKLGDTAGSEFQNRIREMGVELEYELHAACSLLPRSFFMEHPDYFPFDKLNQRRLPAGNWCVSNPGLGDVLRQNVQELGRTLSPSTHRHYFWGEDGVGGWCHCDRCAAYSDSEQALRSVNIMGEALLQNDPAAEIAFLAYNQSNYDFDCKPGENVFLEFAPITRCYCHSIDDPDCAVNRVFFGQLRQLLKIFDPRRTQILEYWLDSSYFSRWQKPAVKPVCSPEIIARDLEAYRKLGIRHFTTFAVFMDGEYFDRHGDVLLRAYADLVS